MKKLNNTSYSASGALKNNYRFIKMEQTALLNKKLTLFILIIMLTAQIHQTAYSQFATASVTEYSTYINALHNKTGCDDFDDPNSSWNFHVSVYDGYYPGNAGFSYRVVSGGTIRATTIPITTYGCDLRHTDVCLVQESNYDVHAIVAYNLVGVLSFVNLLVVEDYVWNGTAFVYQATSFAISVGTTITDVNIDGDNNGNFAIIFDDGGAINLLPGNVTSGFYVYNGYVPVTPSNITGYFPDLSISSYSSTPTIYFSYIENFNNPGDLEVSSLDFSGVAGASVSSLSIKATISPPNAPNFAFGHPRIACPISSNNADWAVVVDETDAGRTGNFSNIIGYNSQHGSGITPIYYNNTHDDLRTVYNWNPVICYDLYDQVWVGWNFDNSSGAITNASSDATYPIVVACNSDGTTSGSDYLEVPNSTIASQAVITELSLAARNSFELMLAYYNYGNTSLYIKYLASAATVSNLKTFATNEGTIADLLVNNNPSGSLTLYLYNLNGQIVRQQKGDVNTIQNFLKKEIVNTPQGLYVVRITSDDGKVNLSEKILFEN